MRSPGPTAGVIYEYAVADHVYRSDQIRLQTFELENDAQLPGAAAYKAGTAVQVHYNPGHPAESAIVPEAAWISRLPALSAGTVMLLLGYIVRATKINWERVYAKRR